MRRRVLSLALMVCSALAVCVVGSPSAHATAGPYWHNFCGYFSCNGAPYGNYCNNSVSFALGFYLWPCATNHGNTSNYSTWESDMSVGHSNGALVIAQGDARFYASGDPGSANQSFSGVQDYYFASNLVNCGHGATAYGEGTARQGSGTWSGWRQSLAVTC